MRRFISHVIGNVLGLYLIVQLMQGVSFHGEIAELVLVGFILGLINFILKPIIRFFSMPFIILSLGLFAILINMAMLKILTIAAPNLVIIDLFTLFWATIIISVINFIVETVFKLN